MRIRLKARVQVLGRIHEAGETIDWPAGVALPFRTTIDASFSIGSNIPAAELRAKCDRPLYTIIEE